MNKKTLRIFYFVLFCIFFVSSYAFSGGEPDIRVGIVLGAPLVNISSTGGFSIYDEKGLLIKTHNPLNVQFRREGQYIIFLKYKSQKIRIKPNDKFLKVGKRVYRGTLELYPSLRNNGIYVINILPLEDYLKGVIRMEISEKWPEEAIKAQAIIARTFALYNWNKHKKEGFNLCATTHCQLYGGVTHEVPLTNKIVSETRGLILTYKGKPIDSVYHSASGGYTEDSEYVWGKYIPYLRAVKSDFEHPSKAITWSFKIGAKNLRKRIYKWYKKDIGEIYDIRIDKRSPHGRIFKLSILGTHGKITLKGTDFRFLLGANNLKSTLFDVKKIGEKKKVTVIKKIDKTKPLSETLKEKDDWTMEELVNLLKNDLNKKDKDVEVIKEEVEIEGEPDIFIFSGRGLGHGVGLSQWGAKALSEMGYNYKKILYYYYHNVKLSRLYK